MSNFNVVMDFDNKDLQDLKSVLESYTDQELVFLGNHFTSINSFTIHHFLLEYVDSEVKRRL